MPRQPRVQFPGAIYHITNRGNAKHNIVYDDSDRGLFLRTLRAVVGKYGWRCYSYCLMDNHYHLVVETPNGNIADGMRFLNGVFAQKINNKYSRVGHIFQGRYKSFLVKQDSYLVQLIRYVLMNPVRANMVSSPEDYKWSSYAEICGTAHIKVTDPTYLRLSLTF